MQDRRHNIIQAGLAVLREYGYPGFTQPRIASRADLRQSHLTYYYPTRLDLLEAVGRTAIERQLAAVDVTLSRLASLDEAAAAIAALVSQHENTRVLMALAQAGDEELRLRELFPRTRGRYRHTRHNIPGQIRRVDRVRGAGHASYTPPPSGLR